MYGNPISSEEEREHEFIGHPKLGMHDGGFQESSQDDKNRGLVN